MAKYNYSAPSAAALEGVEAFPTGLTTAPEHVPAMRGWLMTALVWSVMAGFVLGVLSQLFTLLRWRRFDGMLFLGFQAVPIVVVLLLSANVVVQSLIWLAEAASGRDINNDGWVGAPQGVEPSTDDVRLIPVSRPQTINGVVTAGDLRYFVRTICQTRDWTQRAWVGKLMPSRLKCTQEYHSELVRPLVDARVIVGYGPRTSGELYGNAEGILRLLGLHERNSSTLLIDSE